MQPVFYKGVPIGNLPKVNRLTIPGSLKDVARYRFGQDLDRGAVIAAVGTGINRQYMPQKDNPYNQALRTDIYNVQLNGLGDGDSQMAPGSAVQTSSSGWMDVLNTFVGNVSKGVAAKIGGYNPTIPMTSIPNPVVGIPTWAKIGMAAGGGYLLMKLFKRQAA